MSLEVVLAAMKALKHDPGMDSPNSSFYSGRRSGLEFESGPGAGIGLGM